MAGAGAHGERDPLEARQLAGVEDLLGRGRFRRAVWAIVAPSLQRQVTFNSQLVDRLNRKFESIRGAVPSPVADYNPKASIGFIAAGTSHYAVDESRYQLRKEYNVQTSYLRLRAYPFSQEVVDFVRRHDRVYVVDQNRDAQFLALMRLEFDPDDIAKLRSVRYYGGLPLDARTVTDDVVQQEGL